MVSVRGEVGVVGVPLCLWLQALYVSTCVSLCAYWYVCVSLFTICLCVDEAWGCYGGGGRGSRGLRACKKGVKSGT